MQWNLRPSQRSGRCSRGEEGPDERVDEVGFECSDDFDPDFERRLCD